MADDKYNMSFTTGGLFFRESVRLAELYLSLGDWEKVRDEVINKNLLQARTLSSSKRVCRGVISRLKTLSVDELNYLIDANHQEQGYLLWIAACRQYKFIADFAIEVLRERYITLKTDLSYEDFDSYFNKKSMWHLELEKIQPTTRNKLRQVLFKMLREADLLTTNNIIKAAMLSPRLVDVMPQENRRDVLCFPVFESDLMGMVQ